MSFYNDSKYVGARKPVGYPDNLHFSNNNYHLASDEINVTTRPIAEDFSNIVQSNIDYSGLSGYGSGYGGGKWKKFALAYVVLAGIWYYNKKSKR